MNCKFQTIGPNYHKCTMCGYEISVQQDPSKIFRSCKNPLGPSLVDKIINFTEAMVDYAQSGFEDVSDEEHNRRMDICRGCEFFQAGTCQKCGCSCNFKSKMKAMKCPIGKW